MARVPVTNTGKGTIHRGGKEIPPGETRMIEESLLGPVASAAPVAEPVDPLLALLDQSVPKFIEAIAQRLADDLLDMGELARLVEAENNGNTRKGVIAAIEEVTLQLAARQTRIDEQLTALADADSADAFNSAIQGEEDPVVRRVLADTRDQAFPPGGESTPPE